MICSWSGQGTADRFNQGNMEIGVNVERGQRFQMHSRETDDAFNFKRTNKPRESPGLSGCLKKSSSSLPPPATCTS